MTGILTRVPKLPRLPGEWVPVTVEGQRDATNIMLVCPLCHRRIHVEGAFHNLLATIKHVIVFDADGTVTITPTVTCPYTSCHWAAEITNSQYTERS